MKDCYIRHYCLSVRMEQLDSHGADGRQILKREVLLKSAARIQIWLKSDKYQGPLNVET